MNTPNGNFIETSIPNDNATITLNIAGKESTMKFADFKNLITPEPTPIPEPSYKVYTALLTQNGGDSPSEEYAGDEIYKGITYYIFNNDNNYDLVQYGAPNSNVGTYFVCNQNANLPSDINIQLNYNEGAPTVTVLENTIGNIWFTYDNLGIYSVNSSGLFTLNKTWTYPNNTQSIPTDGGSFITIQFSSSNSIILESSNDDVISSGGNPLRLEIRVYN
jgi:hypothetical protein